MENVVLIVNNFDSDEDVNSKLIYEKYMNLKLAIWEQMEFFNETVGIEDPEHIMCLIINQVEEAIKKYSPATEFFEEST